MRLEQADWWQADVVPTQGRYQEEGSNSQVDQVLLLNDLDLHYHQTEVLVILPVHQAEGLQKIRLAFHQSVKVR